MMNDVAFTIAVDSVFICVFVCLVLIGIAIVIVEYLGKIVRAIRELGEKL